ncbi:hypothetical protein MBLNU459_g0263t1 [Dothideomycetes sp. NU459]
MATISAFTLIRMLSLLHITAAYFFLARPQLIADQTFIVILGESMRLPHPTAFVKATEATAFTGLVLAFLGVTDLVAASLPDRTALEYWSSTVPVRLLLLFATTGYVYLFKDDGVFGSGPGNGLARLRGTAGVGENVKNSLVFSTGFFEVCMWFWVFLALKDERKAFAVKVAEERAREEEERKFRR